MSTVTHTAPVYTTSNGYPISDPESALRVGKEGPLLLQDFHLLDLLAHFDRERIPERVVHAKGAGAYGVFEVTHDITDIVSPYPRKAWLPPSGHFRYSAPPICSAELAKRLTSLPAFRRLVERRDPPIVHGIREECRSSSTQRRGIGTGFSTTPLSSSSVTLPYFLSLYTRKSGTRGLISRMHLTSGTTCPLTRNRSIKSCTRSATGERHIHTGT